MPSVVRADNITPKPTRAKGSGNTIAPIPRRVRVI